jgi:hypothetical protein
MKCEWNLILVHSYGTCCWWSWYCYDCVNLNRIICSYLRVSTTRMKKQFFFLYKIWGFYGKWRMPTSGVWCHVALVRTNVSKTVIASIIWVERFRELEMLAMTSNLSTLRRNTNYIYFCNPILFATCTSTFRKLCKNLYNSIALFCIW